jgi:hypothetical protein
VVDPRIGRFAGPIAAFVAMVVVVMGTAAVLFARKIGFDPAHVQAFYLGSEATFAPPRSLAGLLEVAVPHLLAIPMLVFVTLHLVAFVSRARRRPFALVAGITSACAAVVIAGGFAIRFAWPALAPVKIAAFLGLEGTMLTWLGLLAAAILPGTRDAARPGAVTGSEGAPPRAVR